MTVNSQIYGFSCVENHVLRFIQSRCESLGLLYFDCFMTLSQIFLCSKSNSFEYFDGIGRIQDVLKENSLLTIDMRETPYSLFSDLVLNENNNGQVSQILMLLNASNTKKLFYGRGMRDDHFVEATYTGSAVVLTNDIPLKEIEISCERLEELYGGKYLVIGYKEYYTKEDFLKLESKRVHPVFDGNALIDTCECADNNFTDVLRTTLVVYKIMRNRMQIYMSAIGKAFNITEELRLIERISAKAEYMRLRKDYNTNKLKELVTSLNSIEEGIIGKVADCFE